MMSMKTRRPPGQKALSFYCIEGKGTSEGVRCRRGAEAELMVARAVFGIFMVFLFITFSSAMVSAVASVFCSCSKSQPFLPVQQLSVAS